MAKKNKETSRVVITFPKNFSYTYKKTKQLGDNAKNILKSFHFTISFAIVT